MLDDFLSLFFPRICAACEGSLLKGEKLICTTCDYKMTKMDPIYDQGHFLARKFYGRVKIDHSFAFYVFNKHGRIQNLIHKMKYHQMPEIGYMVGEKLGMALNDSDFQDQIDIIVPVPLHRSKLRRRGYNQSEHFANGLSTKLGKPVEASSLVRNFKTATQTRKSRMARWKNVEHIFGVKDHSIFKGKKVLLVDDVITTGATVESCAEILYESGCVGISVGAMAAAK